MKDEDFEELKNYKSKPTEIRINNTNIKNTRNSISRLKSTEKSYDNKLESVNKKFFRAQSSSFKFFQIKNKLSEISEKKSISEKRSNNISVVVDRNNKKK
jgi:hypothetical protein